MWIKKNEPPEWDYAEQIDLMNVELVNSIDKLKVGENPIFTILDVRDQSERDLVDLPARNKVRNKSLINIEWNYDS